MVPELSGADPHVEMPRPLVAKKPGTEHAAQLEAERGGQAAVRHLHQGFGSGSSILGWIPIRVQGYYDQNWKKITAEKKFQFFGDQKLHFTYA